MTKTEPQVLSEGVDEIVKKAATPVHNPNIVPQLIKRPRLVEVINTLGGHNAIELIESMTKHPEGAVDNIFSEAMNLKVTEVRTILNRLHYRGLVEYTRTRDEEIGWYTYKWHVKPLKIIDLLESKITEELETLKEALDQESGVLMFSCDNQCNSFQFEIAAEYGFRCPDCAGDMASLDNQQETDKKQADYDQLKEELTFIKNLEL